MEQSLSNTLKTSMSKVRESVLQSVDSLKQQRKLRIEVARETGRDNKQTRQIANTNRGHVLHCRYFELLANYRVSTRVASLRPCLMLPLPIPQWSLRWVLAHEAELSRVLLSEAVRPGFVAAKRLGLREQVEALRAAAAAQRGNTGARETELGLLRDKVKAALTTMRHDTELLRDALAEPAVRAAAVFGPIALTIALHIALGSLLALRRALAFAVLRGDTRSHNALLRFEAEPASTKAGDAFARLFADLRVYPEASNDQQVESGLRAAGFGAAIAAVLLAVANLAEAISDDAGLQEHLGAARQTLNAGGSGQGYAASSDGDASAIREDSAELWADAEATVEFQRLRDHLQENAIHYAQALWLMRHPDDRALRLRAFAPYGDLLSPEVVGFFADRVAHPIQNFAAFAHDLDLASLISGVQKQLAPAPDCLLTLPTQGTELITQLGACDACEDFIQDNRRIEIERLQAQADQQKFEARRRQLRLEQSPPVLDDFDELSSAPLLLSAQAQADQVAAP